MKETIYQMIVDYYQTNKTEITASWIFDTFIEQGITNVSSKEIDDALAQLLSESKIIWLAGDFYRPN